MGCDRQNALRVGIVVALGLLLRPVPAPAQELEPGAYWPIPTGLNIATVVNSYNWGDLSFDPAAPIDQASARINTTAFSFTRAINLGGRSANLSVVVPVVGGHVEGLYLGQFAEVGRFGLGDPRVRLALNLYGAPSMPPQEFASYRQRTLLGVSVTVVPPLGQYDSTKLINLGTNRWSVKTEVGFSRTNGKWVVEGMAGVWMFTDNTNFVGGRTREQTPITAVQFHLTHRFTRGMWLAGDANYFAGGRTTIGGTENIDFQKNSRIGTTFSRALDRHQAIRMSLSRGAYTTIGNKFTSIAFGYNYAWSR